MRDTEKSTSFRELGLPSALTKAIAEIGYETPTPIQSQAIPHLLAGKDLLGHAPTGTGKTAAFALPLLVRLNVKTLHTQTLVLTPTRELTIQVAEAFQRYASHLKGFQVLPIYGGQDYSGQLRGLRRGTHVVVGTPGRVMDHMRRGTLKLVDLTSLVLDEADEMLRMGFIEDVSWILEQAPDELQMALFSATMPKEIQRIAKRHLTDPQNIAIKSQTGAAETIHQRYWQVGHLHKLDALTRLLETEPLDGTLIFVRTKVATVELAEKLTARGYAAEALNGDMAQKSREQMIVRLKRGSIDILVATDVAARGLDVDRVSHVINYDIPYDPEAYIHRIGRTGRAGREGQAILFVAPRERRMLGAIERATGKKIEALVLPSTETVNNQRVAKFKQRITDVIAEGQLDFMRGIVETYHQEHGVPPTEVAAALAKMVIGKKALLLPTDPAPKQKASDQTAPKKGTAKKRSSRDPALNRQAASVSRDLPEDMERFRLEVGHNHKVKPGNIVGAIANEAGLDAEHIGHIDIHDEFSFVDLPTGMPRGVFRDLKKTWVCGRRLQISRLESADTVDAPAEDAHATPDENRRRDKRKGGEKAPKRHPKSTKTRKKRPSKGAEKSDAKQRGTRTARKLKRKKDD